MSKCHEEAEVGSYSLIVMSPRKLIGARDPFGFRPLCIGKRDNAYVLASESCALDTIGAEFVRDVEPGEMVVIFTGKRDSKSIREHVPGETRHDVCLNIFILQDRIRMIDGMSVYHIPDHCGKMSRKGQPGGRRFGRGRTGIRKCSCTWLFAASPVFHTERLSSRMAMLDRTFIKPKQSQRESSVRVKLNVLKEAVDRTSVSS